MRRWWRTAASVVLLTAVVLGALPYLGDVSEVGAALADLSTTESLVLAGLTVVNLVTYWLVIVASLPGLSLWHAMLVSQATTALSNTVPGGGAVGIGVSYAMFASFGRRGSEIAAAAVVSGLFNNAGRLVMPVAAAGLLALGGPVHDAVGIAALSGLAIVVAATAFLVAMLRTEQTAGRVDRLVGRLRARFGREPSSAFVRFRLQTVALLRRRWPHLTVAVAVSHLSVFAVFLAALRAVGTPPAVVSFAEAFAAFSVVRLVATLPVTPGGLWVVEVGTVGALVIAGGAQAEAVAATLIYRALTFLLQIPIGVACYLGWRGSRSGGGVVQDD